MNQTHHAIWAGASALAALFAATAPGAGPVVITPVTQHRGVHSFVILFPCGAPTTVSDDDAATDFGPYDATVHSERSCALAAATASASHTSTIGAAVLAARGAASSTGSALLPTGIHAISSSGYSVTIQLDQPARFRLQGVLSAASAPPAVGAYARLRLQDARDTAIFDSIVDPADGGAKASASIDQILELAAGQYSLGASGVSVVDTLVPPAAAGMTGYDFTFALLNPADFDGEGDVDGIDLATLLAGWGGCSLQCVDCCCLTDINCDGVTSGLDLAMLLAAWG